MGIKVGFCHAGSDKAALPVATTMELRTSGRRVEPEIETVKRVIQKTAEDCGAACVAMLAGVSLKKAYNAVYAEVSGGLTYTRHLRDALRRLGRRPASRLRPLGTRRYQDIKGCALLKVNPRGNEWHWVVWDGKRIIDPGEPPYKRYRVVSFLAVN